MGRIIVSILLVLAFLISPQVVHAVKTAGNSAYITYNTLENGGDMEESIKRIAMKRVFEKYHSLFIDEIDVFMKVAKAYNLPYFLLPSIAGNESFFGTYTYPGSFNPFGWNGGYQIFGSWAEAIDTVGKNIRLNYINKGADTVEKIAPIYAEDPLWRNKVSHFIGVFEKEEQKIRLFLETNQVEL